jgi:MerR family transcriptional regulator, light-induced transcriptional regulator
MSELMVSAGEAARRLGVAPATIQRWVDSGVLHAERTPGGHRRIYVTELRRMIAASRPSQLSGTLAHWFDMLMTGDPAKVKAALIASRQATGNWADTADEVASAIAEIGRQWEAGSCQIFEEHAATEALRRAAAACLSEMPMADDAPRAALLTVYGERHTLGLALAELVLADVGWRPLWIGEGPPADELGGIAGKFKPDMIVVSASAASPPAAVAGYQRSLAELTSESGIRLILAGSGDWKRSSAAKRVVTFKELREALR